MGLDWTTLCNGVAASRLPADDRSAALGDGLFETLLVRNGQCVWLDAHLQRLANGCARLGLDFPGNDLRCEISSLLRAMQHCEYAVLRITLGRKSAGARGYAPVSRESNRMLQMAEIAKPDRRYWTSGIRAYLCQTRLPESVATAGLKHNNRLAHVLARAERPPTAFQEGLMLSHSGLLVEGISSNVFLVIDGVLHTPILASAGVEGITRDHILATAQVLGIPLRQRHLQLNDIYRAQELFFCNSLFGIWPVRALDCLQYSGFDISRKLQSELEPLWYA